MVKYLKPQADLEDAQVTPAGSTTKYYFAGASRLAMRQDGTLHFLLSDHLSSTSLVTDAAGNKISEIRYKAWGEVRYASGAWVTDYTYTGQYSNVDDFGLMYYGARWYDPYLSRWAEPDSIVPGLEGSKVPTNPQAWDRFAYVNNSPVVYNDPTGHDAGLGSYNCYASGYCNKPPDENSEILDENGWDYVPIVSDVRGVVRGIQIMDVASGQPDYLDQQAALQTWYNNCYGVCHGSNPITDSPSGGPMPDVPLVDMYSQGMGETASGAVSLLIGAAYAKATTNVFAYGGKEWHVGWQTNDEWSIIHVGNAANPKWGGIYLAIGSVGPKQAFFHVYIYPNPHIHINWPK